MPRTSSPKQTVAARTSSTAARDEKELRVQLAVSEYSAGQHPSIAAAANAHGVAKSTVRHRLHGRAPKKDAQNSMQALSPASESVLVEHIRRCSCSGFPLTPADVCEYGELLAQNPAGSQQQVKLGNNWIQSFLRRHPSIKSSWSRCLDNARIRATDEQGVREWFDRLQDIVQQYQILSNNIYNMDETGFVFGLASSQHVVVPRGNKAVRFKAQPGNRQSATAIECIGSGGQVLPPLIITEGKLHTVGEQRQMEDIPAMWHFSKTARGYTNNELAVEWCEKVFDISIRPLSPSAWRLLILDGHKCHTSMAFLAALWHRRIVPFCLPAHSTHVMQPLDVSIFGPLTMAY